MSFHFRPKVEHGRAEVLLQFNLRFIARPSEEAALQQRFAAQWDRARALCLKILRQAHENDFGSGEAEQRLFDDIVQQLNRALFPEEIDPLGIGPVTEVEVLALFVR